MAPRSSWKGYLKLSLVSVPVKAYTATSSSSSISLNQLHDECHSRIRYKKVCPVHGEIPNSEIVSGYEYAKGQYAVIDTKELDKLRSEGDKSISVDKFFPAEELDSIYDSGTTYYLVHDSPIGQKPFSLIRDAMADTGLNGLAQIVLSNKEQLVRLRAVDKLIVMTTLRYANQIKDVSGFTDEIEDSDATQQELKLTRQLLEALKVDTVNIEDYQDVYTEKLTALIQAKVEGKELVAPPEEDAPQVINLMDALKASVKQVKTPTKKSAARKTEPRKTAARKKSRTKKKTATARRKKKSG